MKLNTILRECEERGYPITAQGLYRIGVSYGFITNGHGTRENPASREFDKDKFEEWITNATKEVPKGYMTLFEACNIYGIKKSWLYNIIKTADLGAERFGSGRGVLYVDKGKLEKYLSECGVRHSGRGKRAND